ncbi:MAG TPA: ribosome biogenesis GTPase Der, partial [Gemmatimonadaceae bacterium]
GGIADDPRAAMDVEIRRQVDEAIGEADLLLFIVDARAGLHPADFNVAEVLRNSQKPWLLVANKVDDPRDADFYEFYQLGVDEVFPVSAINGKNSGDLLDAVVGRLPHVAAEPENSLRVAVIGRPNVGKSSFVNRLLGEERLVVSEVAGTTRDAIDTPMRYHGRQFVFVDTAGLRRQSKIDDGVEFYSSLRTRRAIERADICILMVDATESEIQNQDLKIATLAWESGRGLIVVVNKWDLAAKDDKATAKYQTAAGEKAPFLKFVPFLFTSALTGQRVTRVLELLLEVEQERAKRIGTAEVNAKLSELLARRQPPQAAGHEVKLNYATQIETAPPTIAIFGNAPDLVEEHYVRYLHNGFRSFWGFTGNPLRIVMKRKAG